MTIPTQMSLLGFIATDPDLHFSEDGVARFSARVGVRQFRRTPTARPPNSSRRFTTS